MKFLICRISQESIPSHITFAWSHQKQWESFTTASHMQIILTSIFPSQSIMSLWTHNCTRPVRNMCINKVKIKHSKVKRLHCLAMEDLSTSLPLQCSEGWPPTYNQNTISFWDCQGWPYIKWQSVCLKCDILWQYTCFLDKFNWWRASLYKTLGIDSLQFIIQKRGGCLENWWDEEGWYTGRISEKEWCKKDERLPGERMKETHFTD